MKKCCCLFIGVIISFYSTAQDSSFIAKTVDSLIAVLKNVKQDTDRVIILEELCYETTDLSRGLQWGREATLLARKIKFTRGEIRGETLLGNYFWNVSNYPQALQYYLESLRLSEQVNYLRGIASNLGDIGNVYFSLGNFRKALDYSFKSAVADKALGSTGGYSFDFTTIAKSYSQLNIPDSALFFATQACDSALKSEDAFFIAFALQALSDVFAKKNDLPKAFESYKEALRYSRLSGFDLGTASIMQSMAELCQKNNQTDSCIYYAKEALNLGQSIKASAVVLQSANLLYTIYKPADERESFQYLEIASAAKDSIFNNQKNNELENIANNEEVRQKDKEAAELQYRNNLKFYGLLGGLAAIGFIALIQLRNNKQKKKANLLLERQKQKVETTLAELKSAQAQLIQSEKMASLGELTAGIAHEIQNPLNFVNNFSEVNKELIEELNGERQRAEGSRNAALENELLKNIEENEEKILHHGKRADAIVKGMLQHSRSSTGAKEPTDINALADEYLRLSYHGLRAKDKEFNATINTDFDESIGKIHIVPQDIGRVLLNLYNNAFYAASQISGRDFSDPQKNKSPVITVSTRSTLLASGRQAVEIKVADNGAGIPKNILDKIFQPFFTTKPTGQGTGLGLSLSYDIIKAHGGEIKVETNVEGEGLHREQSGTTFTIQLPVASTAV